MSYNLLKYKTLLMLTTPFSEKKPVDVIARPCKICGELTINFEQLTQFSKSYICVECQLKNVKTD